MDPATLGILIPILAILCGTFLGVTSMRHKAKKLTGADRKLLLELKETHEQNEQLNERVKNLEYIVTSLDKDILKLHAPDLDTTDPKNQIEDLKEEIKRLKS